MLSDVPVDTLFAGSNGRYYTDWEVARKLRAGAWSPCLRQRNPHRRLVETDDGDLLLLTPAETEDLPPWTEIRVEGETARVVDTRRPFPAEVDRPSGVG